MPIEITRRDYSLIGRDSKLAEEHGLASAQWYACAIPRKRLKELMQRKDAPAIRDTLIWFASLLITGTIASYAWGTWWAIPAFAVYGVLYSSASSSRWHECSHRTAFKTPWMNDVIYQMASFMTFFESTPQRWSHTRHHTDTLIVGRDPEIQVARPPDLLGIALSILNLNGGWKTSRKILLHCFGRLTEEEKTFVPDIERNKVYWMARVYALIYAAVIAWSIGIGSIKPIMFVGLPSFYGLWLLVIFALTQHAGLAEDVLDHRLNCRTVYMNPVFRFIYWNMNYHVEHHMFPMVPYHALPALHEEIKADTPPAYNGLWEAFREIVPALLRQVKDPTYYVQRHLPPSAQPVSTAIGAAVPTQ